MLDADVGVDDDRIGRSVVVTGPPVAVDAERERARHRIGDVVAERPVGTVPNAGRGGGHHGRVVLDGALMFTLPRAVLCGETGVSGRLAAILVDRDGVDVVSSFVFAVGMVLNINFSRRSGQRS